MATPAEQIFIEIGRKRYQVESLKRASEMFCAARDKSGMGASEIPEAKVVTADGRFVARVSYNGRVWPNPTWVQGEQPVYDNRI